MYTVVENSVKVCTLAIRPPQHANKLNYTFVQCVAINHITESPTAEYNKSKEVLLQGQGDTHKCINQGLTNRKGALPEQFIKFPQSTKQNMDPAV